MPGVYPACLLYIYKFCGCKTIFISAFTVVCVAYEGGFTGSKASEFCSS